MHSLLVKIRISQPSKVMFTVLGLTNPDVNLNAFINCIMTDNSYHTVKLLINPFEKKVNIYIGSSVIYVHD